MKEDPFEVELVVPVKLGENCGKCARRFLCFTDRELLIKTLEYTVRRALDGNDEFEATFSINAACISYPQYTHNLGEK